MVKNLFRFAVRLLPVLILLLIWEVAATIGWIDTTIVPPPHQILETIVAMLRSGQLTTDTLASLQRVFFGFAMATLAGIFLALMVATLSPARFFFEPLVEILRPIPPIAWIPLAILWFGIGDSPAYFIVFLGAFFPIFTNALAGIQSTERMHLNAARCLGASRWLILTDVVLPSALPSILTGLRVGFGVAWICVITAELVGAQSGLGYMIQLNRLLLQTDRVLGGMVVIGCLGFVFNFLLLQLEKRLICWRTTGFTE